MAPISEHMQKEVQAVSYERSAEQPRRRLKNDPEVVYVDAPVYSEHAKAGMVVLD